MSDKARELRDALDFYDRRKPRGGYVKQFADILDAARTIALPILEREAVRHRLLDVLLDESNHTTGQVLDALLAALVPADTET